MIKRIASALAALAVCVIIHAQEVVLKNGTVYSGYISEQSTSGKVCVTYSDAVFNVPGDSLSIFSSDSRTEVRWGQKVYDSVEILEEGDWVTFRTSQPGSVYLKLSDIATIRYAYSDLLHDVVVTDKSYEGTILETVVGKYFKMDVNGRIVTIDDRKVRSQSKVSVDKDKNLNIRMFRYLDVYEVKDMAPLTGALISQNFVDGSAIFLTRNGSLMPLTVDKITSIRRIPNEAFDDAVPAESDTVDVRINGRAALWLEAKIDKKKETVSFSIDDIGKNIIAVPESYVSVNKLEGAKEMILVPFEPFSAKNHSIMLGKVSELEEDVAIKPSSVITSSGRKITEYDNVAPGFYLVVDIDGARVAPLWVTGR